MNIFNRRFSIGTLWVAIFTLGTLAAQAVVINAGNITGVTITTNAGNGIWTASFALSNGGSAEITPFAPDVVRVNFHWAGPFDTEQPMIAKPLTNWPATSATIVDQGTKYLIQTSELDVEVEKTPFKVHFKSKSGFYLSQDEFTERDADYGFTGQRGTSSSKLKNRRFMPTGQAIFGLGEYGGPMNRRTREIDIWNTGTYNWGEFTNPTYLNIPFFYGVQPAGGGNPAFVYGIFLNNPCRPLFKFGTETGDRLSYQAGDGRMDYFFFGGGANHAMNKVMDRYSELTGRPTFLPKWGLGHHLSRFSYESQTKVQEIANDAGVNDIPLDAVYMDIDYMDANGDGNISDGQLRQLTTNFKFTDPAGMVNYCNARGVKLIPLIEPWLQPGDPLHGEANAAFHFIKDNNSATVTRGIYVGNVSWFDYTSTPMQDWWRGKILNWMNSFNFAGIWNDLTEPEGGDQIPHNGLLWCDGRYGTSNTDSRRWWSNERNYFGLRCVKQSFDTMTAKNPNKRPFVLSRSGTAGLQRYGVSWSGDTAANWFYHRTTIRFGMGAMIAGVAWYGNDVGGFAGSPSGDLMVRSTEANILTPFFRNHGDKSAAPREPWRFGEPHKSLQRELIKFRYRLMPYFYTLAYESTQNGKPMNTPPVFDYFADANTHSLNDYDYMVGDYLLAAPVYNEGASTRQVYLPYKDGVRWYYWHSTNSYAGGQNVTVSAPLGTLPLFARSGAIIPMGPSMQYANQVQASWMDINCWPEGTSEFTLFEDDGESWNYLGNGYSKRRMVSNRTAAYWDFTIEAKQGTYNTGARDFYVYGYNPGTNVVKGVKLNGATLPLVANFDDGPTGWRMSNGRIGVKVPDNGAEAAIRVSFADVEDSLQFASPTHSVGENDGFVRVFVARTGAATGSVGVAFATVGGTALAGSDFVTTNGNLNWAIGDMNNKFFDVVIVDNAIYEGNKTFAVNLSNPVGATLGSPSSSAVTIVENEPIPPALVITNPPGNITVAAATTNYTLQGVANALEWSGLRWSNNFTGVFNTQPASFYWNIPGIQLGVGTNIITVTATNAGNAVLTNAIDSSTAYGSTWADGANLGSGFSPWTFESAGSAGHFVNATGWGLWSHEGGNYSAAIRPFPSPLAVGQTFHVRMKNGWIWEGGGSVGLALRDTMGNEKWLIYFVGGATNYAGSHTTDIGWTDSGLDIAFTLTAATNYSVAITPVAGGATRFYTGSFSGQINQFRTWSANNGTLDEFNSNRDYFVNNLKITTPGGSGASTSATVQIIRPSDNNSQIPQEWRDRYNLVGPGSGDDEDRDGDGINNWEEYISDTNPTNGASFFGKVALPMQDPTPSGVMTIMIQAPTTNSRVYAVSYSTNLFDGLWWPLGLMQTGAADGGAISMVVTNGSSGERHFRAHVFLPE